jgi:hypothetical protein
MDETALNYNKEATLDSGKCKYELADETPVKHKHEVNS